jgi:hypothetical protein
VSCCCCRYGECSLTSLEGMYYVVCIKAGELLAQVQYSTKRSLAICSCRMFVLLLFSQHVSFSLLRSFGFRAAGRRSHYCCDEMEADPMWTDLPVYLWSTCDRFRSECPRRKPSSRPCRIWTGWSRLTLSLLALNYLFCLRRTTNNATYGIVDYR